MKAVGLGRVAGPYKEIPFDNYIQSLVGLVPKAGNQTRLIFHLSYDFKTDGLGSLNHHTPKGKCTVKYRDLDYAVSTYMDLCFELFEEEQKWMKGNLGETDRETLKKKWKKQFYHHKHRKTPIFGGKSDLKSAFRILRMSRSSWKWLVFKARDPSSGMWYYFIDKYLPFGASISCALFQHFSDTLCWLIEFRINEKRRVTNYLDDFLFITKTLMRCNYMISQFLKLCDELGVAVSLEKTEWGSTLIIFLGILLNGTSMVLAIPEEKRRLAISYLEELYQRRKTTVKDLQKLCGYLNFLSKAIFPGRTFIRRMYSKYCNVVNIGGSPNSAREFKLKQYHHVRLDAEFKLDCKVWLGFLRDDSQMQSAVCRPMVDLLVEKELATDISFYSDASAAESHGFGAILGNRWIKGLWPEKFISECKLSIKYLELFTLCVGVLSWKDRTKLSNN